MIVILYTDLAATILKSLSFWDNSDCYIKIRLFLIFLTVTIPGWSTAWWLVSSSIWFFFFFLQCSSLNSYYIKVILTTGALWWRSTPSFSQVCMPLASCLWLHSSSSTTRSVLQLIQIIQIVWISVWTVSDMPSPPLCLDQLKSVSHLRGTVLMYRVSVNTFLWLIRKHTSCGLQQF